MPVAARKLRFGLSLGLWLALVGALPAAPRVGGQAEQAALHYQAGQKAYGEERWTEALREFQLGYALAPRPEFLINFAQVHRKLGRLGDAAIDCERYLAAAPSSAMATEVTRLLAVIREEQAAQLRGVPEPVPDAVTPPSGTNTTAPPVPAATALLVEPGAVTHRPTRRGRAGLIGGLVAGGVVVLGVAITLGVVLTRGDRYPDAPLRGDFR